MTDILDFNASSINSTLNSVPANISTVLFPSTCFAWCKRRGHLFTVLGVIGRFAKTVNTINYYCLNNQQFVKRSTFAIFFMFSVTFSWSLPSFAIEKRRSNSRFWWKSDVSQKPSEGSAIYKQRNLKRSTLKTTIKGILDLAEVGHPWFDWSRTSLILMK